MTTESQGIEQQLPLKPVVLHILLALAESEAHGYGVIQAVRRRSEGRIRLETGPFYRHLRKLLDAGLVAEVSGAAPSADRRRGAVYRLTARGQAVAGAEAARLREVVSLSEQLGLLPGDRS